MGLLSLSWFKSEKQKELEALEVEEKKLKIQQLQNNIEYGKKVDKEEEEEYEIKQKLDQKLYSTIKLVNNTLTVVLKDGTIFSKSDAKQEDFLKVKEAKTENDILVVFATKEAAQKIEDVKKTLESIDVLEGNEDFVLENNSVYIKVNGVKINRSLPKLLIDKFAEITKNMHPFPVDSSTEYQSLKKFWLKCCTNANARSAEDLYEFLSKHQFKIDKHGNFYAYRRVVSKGAENQQLVEFVSNTYTKIKAVWKKKPSNFAVWNRLGDYKLLDCNKTHPSDNNAYWNLVGNLETLYLDLPNMQENRYTSAHTGKEDYRVGNVISMPRNEGNDDNTVSCSRGFHAASKEYDYSGFGDTPILMIINPTDVLSVPIGEVGKLRTCRWFFASVLGEDEQHILDDSEFEVEDLGDVFEEKCLENMQEYIQNSFAEEVKRHTFTLSNLSSNEVSNIVKSLEQMKNDIINRVKTVN
jgi:hypothetical protein